MNNIENTSNIAAQTKRSRKPKLAKYRPQLTKPEIDLIISCLSATLVSGYNNPGLPAVIKKFKLLAHKIDLDAIGASYSVAEPAKRSGFEPEAVNSLANPDAMQPAKQKGFLDSGNEADSKETKETKETMYDLVAGANSIPGSEDVPKLSEEYCWAKYQALGGDGEAMAKLTGEEQALVSMYKANERMELSKEDETRISEYMIKQLSGE